ncbi:MAG: hypothetical protein ACP5UN_00095 [Candidatus Micrarchaeia archaeon]
MTKIENNNIDEKAKLGLIAGKARLDINNIIILWEKKEDFVLLTKFDIDGGILEQLPLPNNDIKKYALEYCKRNKLNIEKIVFYNVKINKNCPYCNSNSLERVSESAKKIVDVPVMPLYFCSKCGKKSFYLTEYYFNFLINNNINLFEPAEKELMKNKEEETKKELRETINRIFIAKGIKQIL